LPFTGRRLIRAREERRPIQAETRADGDESLRWRGFAALERLSSQGGASN